MADHLDLDAHGIDIKVKCVAVTPALRDQGMRAFASVTLDDTLFIDSLTVRITEAGEAVVTWPERKDGQGRPHAIVRILDPATKAQVERAVLAEAVCGGWLEPGRVRARMERES